MHYAKIAPSYIEDISDIHKTEPYVYAQMIAGKEARNFGQAKNSWLTGTASWNFVALSQYIAGIRPDYAGLRVEPRLPSEIGDAQITRVFRGVTYRITVHSVNNTGDVKIVCTNPDVTVNGTLVSLKKGSSVSEVELSVTVG